MKRALILAAILSIPGTAQADLRDPINSSIAYDRQALSSPVGAEKVLIEIEAQVTESCRVGASSNRLRGKIDQVCVSELLLDAVAKIDAPNLSAVYERKTGKPAILASR